MIDEDDADVPGPSGINQPTQQSNGTRRQNYEASAIIEEIDNELQKDQQGVCEDNVLDNLLIKLEYSKVNESSGRGCKVDSLAFKKFSQLMVSKASNLKDGKDSSVNMNLLARSLKEYALGEDDEFEADVNAFSVIGGKLSHLLFKAPKFNYIKPCLPFKENLQVRPKKERVRSQRNVAQTQVIAGKTADQAKEASKDDNSVTKELDIVRRHLKAAWKSAHAGADGSIDYFRFVLHPTSFGESIENMFYVSFLIRDGHVRLNVNTNTGGATIERMSREEKEALCSVDRSAIDTTQFVSKMNYVLWQKLVARLKITKPLIVR